MESLAAYLAQAVEAGLARMKRGHFGMVPTVSTPDQANEIVRDLLAQALATGLPIQQQQFQSAAIGGGNTADVVQHIVLHAPFVFKMDRNSKLAKEAQVMRDIRLNADLPQRFREAWPVIYAIRTVSPYAYLMEYFPSADGWISMEDRLFSADRSPPLNAEGVRLMNAVLDILFAGYEASLDRRMLPSIRRDYVDRIRDRLEAAQQVTPLFRPRSLARDDVTFAPWNENLSRIERFGAELDAFAAPFSTVVHGDPNPGNLLVRANHSAVEVKLIDPKDWGRGDYLFDIAKITHFLEATGPIEKPLPGAKLTLNRQALEESDTLDYSFERPQGIDALVESCLQRVGQFAEAYGDIHWRERYELAMAANILGLPATRYAHKTKPRPEAAIALYGEGLTWLERFCARLP